MLDSSLEWSPTIIMAEKVFDDRIKELEAERDFLRTILLELLVSRRNDG